MICATIAASLFLLIIALSFAIDYLVRTPRRKPRKPKNIGRAPWVDIDGLRNQQARGMGYNPRGKR